jgi:hypothetical protein
MNIQYAFDGEITCSIFKCWIGFQFPAFAVTVQVYAGDFRFFIILAGFFFNY